MLQHFMHGLTAVLHLLRHCSMCEACRQQPPLHLCMSNALHCSCMAGAAKQGKEEAAKELESGGDSDGGSGAEPPASASGSDFEADSAEEQEEEAEGAAQAGRPGGEEEGVAQEAPGCKDASGWGAPSGKAALQPSRSPASEKAGAKKRMLVLSDDED